MGPRSKIVKAWSQLFKIVKTLWFDFKKNLDNVSTGQNNSLHQGNISVATTFDCKHPFDLD